MNLPRDISNLICVFAYGVMCKRDILDDVTHQASVQKNIPCIFLTQSLPTEPLFPLEWLISTNHHMYVCPKYVELFTPNPFRAGNAYFPSLSIHPQGQLWSTVPLTMCGLLRNEVVRKNRRYKGSLHKNVGLFLKQSLYGWNIALETIFHHKFWYDAASYEPMNPLQARLIRRWVAELEEAAFVC